MKKHDHYGERTVLRGRAFGAQLSVLKTFWPGNLTGFGEMLGFPTVTTLSICHGGTYSQLPEQLSGLGSS